MPRVCHSSGDVGSAFSIDTLAPVCRPPGLGSRVNSGAGTVASDARSAYVAVSEAGMTRKEPELSG